MEIRIDGGATFTPSANEDYLLSGALRAGIGWPYECGVGGCGACRYDLVEGEMETLWPEAPGLSERDRHRGKRLACQSRPLTDCVVKVRPSDEYTPAIPPVRQTASLSARRMLTHDMAELTFQADTADFLAGQFALFRDPAFPGVRAYSMSNQPNAGGEWRFIVRRVPGGAGSGYLCDAMAVGETMQLDGPYGNAYWRATDRPMVCVAGGSGLAPMLSVAQAARAAGTTVRFFDGARTRDDLCTWPLAATWATPNAGSSTSRSRTGTTPRKTSATCKSATS